jgi:DNA-binding MurR/RpiR family transcriptional regulator
LASAIIAKDFMQKLTRINRWCEIGTGFDAQATIAANLIPADVVFVMLVGAD